MGAVVVTGGTGALGRWVVKRLLESFERVVVTSVDDAEAQEVEEALGAPDGLEIVRCDVTSPDDVQRFFEEVVDSGPPLDALCNLVGGFSMGALADTDPATWDRMIALNATSTFLCTRAAVALMDDGNGGRVVNVASLPAISGGAADMSAYAASKAAVVSLTESLAKELRARNVTVNAVAPEIIDTPANREAMPDADRDTWLQPEDIAEVVAFLLGPHARCVTGAVLPLKG